MLRPVFAGPSGSKRSVSTSVRASLFVLALSVGLAALSGCPGSIKNPDEFIAARGMPQCSMSVNVERDILGQHCATAGCHDATSMSGNLDLASAGLAARLVGVQSTTATCSGHTLVVAGDPDNSLMVQKVGAAPPCGSRMPLVPPLLTNAEANCLRVWAMQLSGGSGMDGGATDSGAMDSGATDTGVDAGRDVVVVDTGRDVATDVPRDAGCASGQTLCGTNCINTATNPNNCGRCGMVCPSGICTAGACQPCGTAPGFAADVQPIFTTNCAISGCHSGATPRVGMSLEDGMAHGSLVGQTSTCSNRVRVVARAAGQSYLINKLTGQNICGARMPAGGAAALSASDIATIRAWICNGAAND